MKTASYVLEEQQIEFVKAQARESGGASESAVMRRILGEEIRRTTEKRLVAVKGVDGNLRVDPSFGNSPVSQEQVSTN